MPRGKGRDWTDAEMLDVLERTSDGQSSTIVGKRYGVSRAAVLGLLKRCRDDSENLIGPALDGTMPKGWWKTGLAARSSKAA